ncbi:DUF4383 domain-containing protein [Mycobacterium servetii]|uniref:DUF4383 domain-containing protein n=1 Tax=Mycobacterium servetii TaxID=3237418 RepID=A0ABV4BV30_9MYCO
MDPRHFRSGRWWVLAEGVLVAALGVAGLVSAARHPHAGPTGAPVLGLATTPAHSGMLLAFGVVAVGSVGNRRAAVTVTGFSAAAYTILLFVGAVAATHRTPTPLGFHAADVVLHGVLAVVNLGLLMWLAPDALADPVWVRRRRESDRRQRPSPAGAVSGSAADPAPNPEPSPAAAARSGAHPGDPPAGAPDPLPGPQGYQFGGPTQPERLALGGIVAVVVLVAVIGIWLRLRRRRRR